MRMVLRTREVSEMTGLSERTLERQRVEGGGIPYVALGPRRIGYLAHDVEDWLNGRRVASTSAAAQLRGENDA